MERLNLNDQRVSCSCHSCKGENMDVLVDLGSHPVSNRFLKNPQDEEKLFNLTLGQCGDCALVQLTEYVPIEHVKPTYSWINYLEPEAHLNDLAVKVSKLSGISKGSRLLGLSYKDTSFLERLKKHCCEGVILDMPKHSLPKHEKVDLLVARHILEHSHDLNGLIGVMKGLVKPSGYIIVEVPDFEKSLHNLDYSAIWEEHVTYFTEHTLRRLFGKHNLAIEMVESYPYPMENCLVLVAQNSAREPAYDTTEMHSELELGKKFKESFVGVREGIRDFLRYNDTKGIAMMGAGHFGCAFVNYFGVGEYVKFFIDDNPDKKGLYMPGSKLEILDSSILRDRVNIGTVLLGINPRNEEECVENNRQFIEGGGKFYSIFRESSMPLPVFLDASDLHLLKKSEEVYCATDEIVGFSRSHIDFLKSNMHNSKTGRIRICAHKNPGSAIHEMLIIFGSKGNIRPHKHVGKTESFHIIEGAIDIALFDEEGNTVDVIRLDSQDSCGRFFYRLGKPEFHVMSINSDHAIVIETTQGPFDKEETVFAPWSLYPEPSKIS